MILATSAVHSYLIKNNLRTFTSLNVSSLECLDVHYFAVLIGVGATTVNAALIEKIVCDRLNKNIYQNIEYQTLLTNYKKAIEKGLRKIISKMGISIISSYRGGRNLEIIGLSRSMVESFFPGMTSRISGIGLEGLEKRARRQHDKAFISENSVLDIGGEFRFRVNNEAHAYEGVSIHMLQEAVTRDSYNLYKNYTQRIYNMKPIHIRDLLKFNDSDQALKLDSVQSISEIRKSFVSPGISLGALSPEAHETLAIAMNRIGSKSDSGEGGEDSNRYKKLKNGDNPSSSIKQVASGRFGVTAEYLNNCHELKRRGLKLGIVTNTFNPPSEKMVWFKTVGIDTVWDSYADSCELGIVKPEPGIYMAALNPLKIHPENAVFVGHAQKEIDGAKKIGMTTVRFNSDPDCNEADFKVDNFGDLLNLELLKV